MAFSTKESLLLLLGFCTVFKGLEGIENSILKYFNFRENNQAECFQQERKQNLNRACFDALFLDFISIASYSPFGDVEYFTVHWTL